MPHRPFVELGGANQSQKIAENASTRDRIPRTSSQFEKGSGNTNAPQNPRNQAANHASHVGENLPTPQIGETSGNANRCGSIERVPARPPTAFDETSHVRSENKSTANATEILTTPLVPLLFQKSSVTESSLQCSACLEKSLSTALSGPKRAQIDTDNRCKRRRVGRGVDIRPPRIDDNFSTLEPCEPEETHNTKRSIGERVQPFVCPPSPTPECHLTLRSDSVSTVYAWKKGSKILALNDAVSPVFQQACRRGVFIAPQFIPGKQNARADWLSRNVDPKSYQLIPEVFREICSKFQYYPNLDVFANRRNRHVRQICSWRLDPLSLGNAFNVNWAHYKCWINPPWEIIPQVLNKLQEEWAQALICLPYWESPSW